MTTRPVPRWPIGLLIVLGLLAALVGCGGSPAPVAYDEQLYAAAICEDRITHIRVHDYYCPIGDGLDNGQFGWVYREYRDDTPDIEIVYVGYPVDRTVYVHDRPARVRTTNIDRGRFPEQATTAATTGTSTARVVTIAEERRVSTRGGLGVSRDARAAEAPRPGRSLDSKAPGRAGEAKPKPLPKPPATRVVATKVKTGSK